MSASTGFKRRLELVRRIARINACRTVFDREEERQFVFAAQLFSTEELQKMLSAADAAASQPGSHHPNSSAA